MGNTVHIEVATGTTEFATKAEKFAWTWDECYIQQKGKVPVMWTVNYICAWKYDTSTFVAADDNLA